VAGRYVAVCGPIGVGKTTLARHVATDVNGIFLPERFDAAGNPFLERFYQERREESLPVPDGRTTTALRPTWSLATELSFLCQRIDLARDASVMVAAGHTVITDWSAPQNLIFAKLTLPSDEYDLYEKLYLRLMEGVRLPDVTICLDADLSVLASRIKGRGRDMEKGMSLDYLQQVRQGYRAWRQVPPTSMIWMETDTFRVQHEGRRKAALSLLHTELARIEADTAVTGRPSVGQLVLDLDTTL